MMPTQKAFDTFEFANSIDLSKYSAILAVGGDGSFYEVVNGMLMREDGLNLPVGLVPNGSGNTTSYLLGIESVEEALDTVVTATASKFDVTRVLADSEREEDVPTGKAGYSQRRFSLCSVMGGWLPKMANDAIPLKPYLGPFSYLIQFGKMLISQERPRFQYDAEKDGIKWPKQDGENHSIVSDAFFHFQGKFMGHGCAAPFSAINDGLLEIYYFKEQQSITRLMKVWELSE